MDFETLSELLSEAFGTTVRLVANPTKASCELIFTEGAPRELKAQLAVDRAWEINR